MVNIKKVVASMDDMTRLHDRALDVLKAESGSESDLRKHMQCASELLDGILLFMSKAAVQHEKEAPFIAEVLDLHAEKVQQSIHAAKSTKEINKDINAIRDVLAGIVKKPKGTSKDENVKVVHIDATNITSAEDLMKLIQENVKKIADTKH